MQETWLILEFKSTEIQSERKLNTEKIPTCPFAYITETKPISEKLCSIL